MRAWQYTADGVDLVLNEVPDPVPGPNELVIAIKASGLCHSDVGFIDGTISYLLPHAPITLGHEIVGVVESIGSAVTRFAVGDRVGVPADIDTPGTASDGGFADKVAVQEKFVLGLPDNVPFDQAATASCAGRTAYHSLEGPGQIAAGMKVGIVGLGGLGSFAAQIAVAKGATVYGAEINTAVHEAALAMGLTAVSTDIRDFKDEQLDLIADFAGFGASTTGAALDTVRDRGRVVIVGLGSATGELNTADIVLRNLELVGSQGGTMQDYADILQLMSDGTVSSRVEHIGFEDISDGMHRLENGGLTARLVAVL